VIIGHEATRAGLLADPVIDGCPPFWDPVPDWGNVTRRPPTLTITLINAPDLPGVLAAHDRYYQLILDTARAGLRGGLSPLDTARRCELGTFAGLPDAERIVLNLHRAYADAACREPDLVQAFTDTVAYHGRPMRTGDSPCKTRFARDAVVPRPACSRMRMI